MKPYVIQPEDVEILPSQNPMYLLADADVTDGAVSISRGRIAAGADNAKPHFHERSWEIFAIQNGTLQMLLDDEVVTVGGGGLIAVPPGVVHAFGATPESDVEAVVFVTPGVQRFDYFRLLPRILAGEIPQAELEEMHRTYACTSFRASSGTRRGGAWRAGRTTREPRRSERARRRTG